MSLEKLGLLLGAASLVSMVIGYYLRILVAKSKKGSMELDIQQMMLQAKDKEQKIIEEAERKAHWNSALKRKKLFSSLFR
jgi:hypothetical protein